MAKTKQPTLEQVQAMRQQNIGRLLLRSYRLFSDLAAEKMHSRGYTDLSSAAIGFIPHIDLEGSRSSALTDRAGISKQAVGQFVAELEKTGYISRAPDPDDKRAFIVLFTDKGLRFLREAYEVKLEIEAEFAARVGTRNMQLLIKSLEKLLEP